MNQQTTSRWSVAARGSRRSPMIEGLEDRRLLSASLVQLSGVKPGKILAGTTATETVTVRNLTAATVTETVTISLAPSLDGTTAAGAYASPAATQTLTIKKRGAAKLKVPFVPPTTLAAGRYHTLASVLFGTPTSISDQVTAVAPGTYILTLPPAPTVTPSLVGHYSGLIRATSSTSTGLFGTGTNTRTKLATFIWNTTDQTLTTLTGLFAVGSQQVNATMTGSENTTGAILYTLASDNINYVIKGKVTPDGTTITGTFKGTLVNNIFKTLNGTFKITRQTA